jgi:RNA polymerase sigma factor (sigma-70 family)
MALALRAGDGDAMAQIYDAYADRLYDYCHALLRDQHDAAGALHDGLVVVQQQHGRLQDPDLFRGWLYAVVRNECLRRMYHPARPAERHEAPEVEDPFLDVDERARREEARHLVHSALSGLNGRQREAVDLELRHELEPHELTGVLGLSPQQAAELSDQAKAGLDDALAAALIARSGRGECPSVAALVDTWEWPLTPAVCRKLVRHIETCPVCGERRKRKVAPTRLLQALPVAALPPELRQQLLVTATAADMHPARIEIAQRAEPFDQWGWPVRPDRHRRPAERRRPGVSRLWPALAAAACVLFVVGAVFLYLPRSSDKPAAGPAQGAIATGDSAPVSVSPSEDESLTDSPSPSETPSSTPPTTRTPTHTTRPPSPRPTTRRPSTRPPTPRPPTVTITGCDAGNGRSCFVSITARGGTVTWSASGSGLVSAAGSGTLRDGETNSVRASVDRSEACDHGEDGGTGAVVFTPGGSAPVSWEC